MASDPPFRFQAVDRAEIAYRVYGRGEPLLLIHGWGLSGLTYRKVLPKLSERFECVVIDLPGAGESRWQEDTDFGFLGQARNLRAFADSVGLSRYHLVAHDTGATIARQLALLDSERVQRIVLIDTEIPFHPPAWVPTLQKLTHLPGSGFVFRQLLRSRAFVRSSLGFGGCFVDPKLLEGDFHEHFIRPLIGSSRRMEGQMRYARAIDWALVDRLAEGHARITAPVLLIWGEQDPFFPIEFARAMVSQFANCVGLEAIPGAKLLPHEEKPEEVARQVLEFLRSEVVAKKTPYSLEVPFPT